MQTTPADDGFGDFSLTGSGDRKAQEARENNAPDADPADRKKELEAIRNENLSPRQMRIARRIAKLHKIQVKSDEEAVLELRRRDIDPSHRAALGKVLSDEGQKALSTRDASLPAIRELDQPVRSKPALAAYSEEARALEVQRIQRELVKRRRWRISMLAMRLLIFVFIPTAVTGWYYFVIATPLYETQSQFQIQLADTAATASGAGGALSSSPLAVNTDAVGLQSYLMSRVAMARLDEDIGFKQVFQDPSLDPITRLPPNATNEDAYQVYKEAIKVSYDPTEGVINMRTIAPTPEKSSEFSHALLDYAEEQVDHMSYRLRKDQMEGATKNYMDAEADVLAAQQRVQELQTQLGVLDPVAESSVIMSRISQMESELINKQLELGQVLANSDPVQSRVEVLEGDIARLKELIEKTRLELTDGRENQASLAEISGALRLAEGDLETRQTLLAAAAEQRELARIEANKQVRYLSLTVRPLPPDEATYPKAFQNTVVAFVIFSGIYLLLSLTVSILREQVST